jgi:hypothetical protein
MLDEPYLIAPARCVELSPLRAGLIAAPSCNRWSSAAAQVSGCDDALMPADSRRKLVANWSQFHASDPDGGNRAAAGA